MRSIPSICIAANASNAGKTTAALALASALGQMGYYVCVAKSGPDFLDAAWLTQVSQAPVLNLDLRMGGQEAVFSLLRRLRQFTKNIAQIPLLLIEGAMGLYDGDREGRGSCAELAAVLHAPVLLLLNARGMGQSIAALAQGFLQYETEWMKETGRPQFCGVACTHTGGSSHRRLLQTALHPVLQKNGLPEAGFFPALDAPQIPSRHLGLVQAREAAKNINFSAAGEWATRNFPLTSLLKRLGIPTPQAPGEPVRKNGAKAGKYFFPTLKSGAKPRIAIAFDDAFSFCYADLPLMLSEMGAAISFFSPLQDSSPPPCDGLYFPGGYPELFAEQLYANRPMRENLRLLAKRGLPVYGECGGYMYLMQSISTGEKDWPMLGLLPLSCRMGSTLSDLGYRDVTNTLTGTAAKGHEFHYARLENMSQKPLWLKATAKGSLPEGCISGSVWGSWIHLYPEGSQLFWKDWLARACPGGKII